MTIAPIASFESAPPASFHSAERNRRTSTLPTDLPKLTPARRPPESRGLARDEIRLLTTADDGRNVAEHRFGGLAEILDPGDVIVANVSAVRNAAFTARRDDGSPVRVHLSTRLPGDIWILELRQPRRMGGSPIGDGLPGERLAAGEARVQLLTPYRSEHRRSDGEDVRLWVADVQMPPEFLETRGSPVRYGYLDDDVPARLDLYQNVYATVPGSAEPPSAGRGFSGRLLAKLVAAGVQLAPVVLHCGVSSLEADEPPHEEYFEVGLEAARTIRAARTRNRRIVAVGTTVLRALESSRDDSGTISAARGWTDLIFEPSDRIRSADGLITGFHPPDASHLAVLSAFAGPEHLERAYRAAAGRGLRAHEFGDAHLMWRK